MFVDHSGDWTLSRGRVTVSNATNYRLISRFLPRHGSRANRIRLSGVSDPGPHRVLGVNGAAACRECFGGRSWVHRRRRCLT
jgi:hypothetical protein